MTEQTPHILILTRWGDYDEEMPLHWDEAKLECPHQPPSPLMPCATYYPCGCALKAEEITNKDWGTGSGPCPKSPTGEHRYDDGVPSMPIAECWALPWVSEGAVDDLDWGPGWYEVIPEWTGWVELRRVDAEAVER